MSRPTIIRAAVAGILAGWFLWTTAVDSPQRSATVDEPRHLAGGWTYWKLADYRIHPENGPLTQRWLALPFFVLQPNLPTDDSEFRKPSFISMRFASSFLHRSGNDAGVLLTVARAMSAALGLVLATVAALASRWLFPGVSGLLTFALVLLCPNIVAHAGVATSDVAAALGFLLAIWTWALLLERITPARVLASAVTWGLLAGFKMSAALIAPVAVVAALPKVLGGGPWAWRAGSRQETFRSRKSAFAALIALMCVHAVVAASMVWSYYGFRYSAVAATDASAKSFTESWEQILEGQGAAGSLIAFARDHQLLPEAYLFGFGHALKYAQQWPAFLNGRTSATGWWYYFPLAFLMKTPLPTLALLLLTAWLGFRQLIASADQRHASQRSQTLGRSWPFLTLIVLYFIIACRSNLNVGYRHLLPILAPLFALMGGLELASRSIRIFSWLLVAWLAVENVAARPHYLSYFNELSGGRNQGYRRLSDSNVDWGQDLPAFARWVAACRAAGVQARVYFLYFGEDSPSRFGLDLPEPFANKPTHLDGWYCFSATAFVSPSRSGVWGDTQERQYQDLLALPETTIDGNSELTRRLRLARQLRVMAGLAKRSPDANIGGSILAFHLSESDVERLLTGPPPHR